MCGGGIRESHESAMEEYKQRDCHEGLVIYYTALRVDNLRMKNSGPKKVPGRCKECTL